MRGSSRYPAEDFAQRALPLSDARGEFFRCAIVRRPLLDWDARATSRFSHPTLPHPVLYLAENKLTCFWECFGDELNDQPPGEKAISCEHHLAPRQWVRFTIRPALRVIDDTQPATLRALGADGATFLADYAITRAWAEALMRHPAQIDGFFYRSRLDSGQRCLAVFGRPQLRLHDRKRFQPKKAGALLRDLGLLLLLVDEGIGLL
jgi:hypothetical protein